MSSIESIIIILVIPILHISMNMQNFFPKVSSLKKKLLETVKVPLSCSYSSKYLVFLTVFNLQNKGYYLKSNLMECNYRGLYNTMASII